jgi:hypothetical protein
MTTTIGGAGRLCNHVFRNIAVSMIATKFNLYVTYGYQDKIEDLGIPLFSGTNRFNQNAILCDDNFFEVLNAKELNENLSVHGFYQTKEISREIYNYLRNENIKNKIILKNPFTCRYSKNNDCFIHIRLGDVSLHNPGITYYLNALSAISFDKLYIGTDEPHHSIITEIKQQYSNLTVLYYDEVNTIQFASTCKHVVLSHGTFSAIIGYLSFFSQIYYPEYESNKSWYGDIFSMPEFREICFVNK